MDNVVYHWGNFADKNAKYVEMELRGIRKDDNKESNASSSKGTVDQDLRKNKLKHFILTNAMAWDLQVRNIPRYLMGIHDIITFIKNNTLSEKETRIVYMSGVGYANKVVTLDPNNGYIMRALNKIVLEMMTEAGIEVLDIYNMLYSVNDKFANVMHYLFVSPKNQNVRGKFGKVVADTLFTTMCL